MNWGGNCNWLVLTISDKHDNTHKHYFETNEIKTIQWMIEVYTSLISGKSMRDIEYSSFAFEKKCYDIKNNLDKKGKLYIK